MSLESRLERLGLLHLKDKPEELEREMQKQRDSLDEKFRQARQARLSSRSASEAASPQGSRPDSLPRPDSSTPGSTNGLPATDEATSKSGSGPSIMRHCLTPSLAPFAPSGTQPE